MKISIVVPIYNSERYLRECLDSIANQTYDDIEVIMVNDGSTDSSEKICTEFSSKDVRFIYEKKDNRGVCSARNIGLEKCSGDIVGFTDSDDILDERFCEELVYCMDKYDADIVQCNFLVENRLEFTDWKNDQYSNEEIMYAFLHGKICNRIMNKIYKKEIICQRGGGIIRFPEDRCIREDAYWMANVLCEAKKVVTLSKGLYHYRTTLGSLSRKSLSKSEMLGKYRNDIEKQLIINERIAEKCVVEQHMIEIAKECLLSFNDLSVFNVYELLKQYFEKESCDSIIAKIILSEDDYLIAQRRALFNVLISTSEDFNTKKYGLWNYLHKHFK